MFQVGLVHRGFGPGDGFGVGRGDAAFGVVLAGEAGVDAGVGVEEGLLHAGEELGFLGAEVVLLVRVGLQVVELKGAVGVVVGEDLHVVVGEGGFFPEAEGDGARAGADLASEEGLQADAIERLKEAVGGQADEVGDGGEEVDDAGGVLGDAGLDAGGPFDDAGDAQAALIDGAFVAAQAAGGVRLDLGQAAVVAVENDESVVGDAEVAQLLTEGADAAVHRDELAVVVGGGVVEVREGGFVGIAGFEGGMRGAVPEDGKEGLASGVLLFDEAQGFSDDDFGGVAGELLGHAVAAEPGVHVDEVGGGDVGVEAEGGGAAGVGFEDGGTGAFEAVEVPLAEVAGGVTGFLQGLGDGFFLEAEGVAVAEDAGALVGAAGEDGGAGGGADGVGGVEAVEAEAVGGHGVEVRGLQNGVAAVAGLAPAHVIGHDEEDVRAGGVGAGEESGEQAEGEEAREHAGGNARTGASLRGGGGGSAAGYLVGGGAGGGGGGVVLIGVTLPPRLRSWIWLKRNLPAPLKPKPIGTTFGVGTSAQLIFTGSSLRSLSWPVQCRTSSPSSRARTTMTGEPSASGMTVRLTRCSPRRLERRLRVDLDLSSGSAWTSPPRKSMTSWR